MKIVRIVLGILIFISVGFVLGNLFSFFVALTIKLYSIGYINFSLFSGSIAVLIFSIPLYFIFEKDEK